MASDNRGGYRRPTHPAAASGPGRLSRRTDGRQPEMTLDNAKYGEQQAFQQAQAAAPMSASSGGNAAPSGAPAGPDLSQIVPMNAPSQMPEQPVTAGLPMGPGAGSTMAPQAPSVSPETAAKLRQYVPTLVLLSSRDDADPQTKQFVRQLRAELG